MKKMLNFIFIFIVINGFYIQVDANSGPPENVSVTILNIDENYELDIFIPLDRTLNEADYIEAQTRISNLASLIIGTIIAIQLNVLLW